MLLLRTYDSLTRLMICIHTYVKTPKPYSSCIGRLAACQTKPFKGIVIKDCCGRSSKITIKNKRKSDMDRSGSLSVSQWIRHPGQLACSRTHEGEIWKNNPGFLCFEKKIFWKVNFSTESICILKVSVMADAWNAELLMLHVFSTAGLSTDCLRPLACSTDGLRIKQNKVTPF